jgi:hypothetical protein
MQNKQGRSRPPRKCSLVVELLESRSVLSALGSAPEPVPDAGLVSSAHHASAQTSTATAQDGNNAAGPGNTDSASGGGQQGSAGATGDNQSGPQQGDIQSGEQTPGSGTAPARDQADGAAQPNASSVGNVPAFPPTSGGAVVAFLPAGESSGTKIAGGNENNAKAPASAAVPAPPGPEHPLAFATQPFVEQWLPLAVPPKEARGAGPAVSDRRVEPSPQVAGVGLRRQGGASPQDGLVPRLAGELPGALVIDAAALQRGLRRFLDQLGSLGPPPSPGAGPWSLPWLGIVWAVLPWLGAATTVAAVAFARRRRRNQGAFGEHGMHDRWEGALGLPEPPSNEEP